MTVDDAHPPEGEKSFLGHPFGLLFLVFAEAFERFSYYGMKALLPLYLTHWLLLPGHVQGVIGFKAFRGSLEHLYGPMQVAGLSSVIVGLYGFTYLTPMLGGFIADQWLGRRNTVTIGAVIMVFGHFMMAFDQSFLVALVLILLGVGCFKGNISSQVGALYGPNDIRAGTAFQVFYLIFNIAVIIAPIVCTGMSTIGWSWGFGTAGISMALGLAVYLGGRRWLPKEPPRIKAERAPRPPLTNRDWQKIGLLLLLLPLLGASMVMNEQIFNNYITWGNDAFNLHFFGRDQPASYLVSVDATMSMIFLSGSIIFWRWYATRWKEPDEMAKMAFSGFFAAVAPLALVAAAMSVHPGHKASLWWAIVFELFNDIGFANLVPVGLALYARVAPQQVNGTMVGVYMGTFFLADMAAGALGNLMPVLGAAQFWLLHGIIVGAAALGLFFFWRAFRRFLAPREANVAAAG
jgi:POT family proton-dependent oligopeptide transporter